VDRTSCRCQEKWEGKKKSGGSGHYHEFKLELLRFQVVLMLLGTQPGWKDALTPTEGLVSEPAQSAGMACDGQRARNL